MAFDRTNGPIVRTAFEQADPTGKTGVYNSALVQTGVVPAARLPFATDASNADTLTIGGHVFKFLTTLIAADTTTQVKRGTSAADTLASLVKAINGTASTNVVVATTPFALSVVADAVTATVMRLRLADARGGNPKAGVSDSITLAEALTPAASIWNCANLNVSGKSPSDSQCSLSKFTVTAAMVTAASFDLELAFTPTVFIAHVTASTGILRSCDEAVTISGTHLHFVMAGGGSPNLQAGDLVTVLAVA